MSLFSSFRKNKQEPASDDSAFYSRAEEESKAVRSRKRRSAKPQAQGAEQADPVLPEKKRARRRLIGAVALVLAAVVGLPMLLDSEPKPVADDIAIQIPSKDKPAAASSAGSASANPSAPASSGVNATAALDPKEEVVDPADIGKPSVAAAAPAATAAVPKTESPKQAAAPNEDHGKQAAPTAPLVKADVKPETRHESKPEPKPEPKSDKSDKADKTDARQAEKLAEAARAKALLEGKPDPSLEKKSSKFVIQVAALATREKVNELQTKLKDAGIHSFTQTVSTDGGSRTRIRVGPFTSKDEAEKVRAKIVKLGLNGTLVPA